MTSSPLSRFLCALISSSIRPPRSKYNELEVCALKSLEGKCNAEVRDLLKLVLEKYTGELLGTVCTAYRSGDKCKSITFDSAPGDKNIRAAITPLIKVSAALG